MHLSSRKQDIMDLLREKKNVRVSDLVELLGVAPATVRRDIVSLEREGLISRTHGEIHVGEVSRAIPSMDMRSNLYAEEKQIIGRFAASLITPGKIVAVDSGTTTLALAQHLAKENVTVLTNSLHVCCALANGKATAIASGGMLESSHMCFLGPDAEYFFRRHESDILFLGTTGASGMSGFTTSSPLQYNLKQVMLQTAKKKYVLCDLSKFNSTNLYLFAQFSEVDGIITTRPEESMEKYDQLSKLEKLGVPVLFAK